VEAGLEPNKIIPFTIDAASPKYMEIYGLAAEDWMLRRYSFILCVQDV
jgi:hypothetical protein